MTEPTLPEWLLARIAEDIGLARQVQAQAVTDRIDPDDPRLPHLTLAARVLAECEAKRRIVEWHSGVEWHVNTNLPPGTPSCATCGDGEWYAVGSPCATLLELALPYADRPGYRDEWRP